MFRILFIMLTCLVVQPSFAELEIEQIPNVITLPAKYPDSWLFAHDLNFTGLVAGKVIILDVAADSKEYKGSIGAAQFATFVQSSSRPELYVGETFYSRGTTGIRTDVVSIYDKRTLEKTAEIVLPQANRGLFVTNKFAMRLVDDDRYLLVYNFTPASSVSIIDIETQTLLDEIAVPGCGMIYPTGARGFSSLCSDGSMVSIQFDTEGQQTEKHVTPAFFSVDDDPVFDKPSYAGKSAYFISYLGTVYPLDFSTAKPKVLPSWTLLPDGARAAGWRPSGWQVITNSGDGDIYVIMQSGGFDGSHKSGGEQIWVANTATKKVTRQIETREGAFSIEYIAAEEPLLAVTNLLMGIDVYDDEGEFVRTYNLGDAAVPFVLHSQR